MSYGIFIFTRDLRLEDNIPLIKALKDNNYVLPIFIFNPEQITDDNSYKSNNCVQFMIECLDDLDNTLKKKKSRLFYFYGDTSDIIKKIIKKSDKYEFKSVYISQDYSFFAKKREHDLQKICRELNINLFIIENHMLTGVDKVKKDNGEYYKKFTPYYNNAKNIEKLKPIKNTKYNYIRQSYSFNFEYDKDIHKFYIKNNNILVRGGRINALKILKKIKNFKNYNTEREIPSIRGTTYLSAYLKFNVISIREVYAYFIKTLSRNNKLFTQLYWRDFYMHIMYHYNPIKSNRKYDIKWENNANWIKKWKYGTTGIPIIDAAMTQMNTCGWMHNRCRMIVSNFFIKIMRCDWTIGEKYFAQMLVDYDFCNNNGGWNWSASAFSGFEFSLDSQPYFRVFNPWRQAETYDAECTYIKKWLHQLKDVPVKDILNWNDSKIREKYKHIDYPKPMIEDIQEEFKKTLNLIK